MPAPPPDPILPPTASGPAPAGFAAVRLLPGGLRGDLGVLGRFVSELRAVADHPALDADAKADRLAAVSRTLEGAPPVPGKPAAAAARDLAALISARGLDARLAAQMVQAAAQDLRKARYRDWSELHAWLRFSAAPAGALAHALARGTPPGRPAAEAAAMALQLLACAGQAPCHYRWLGRLYLPERWFTETGADPAGLARNPADSAFAAVFVRAGERAAALLAEARSLPASLPRGRPALATAVALAEAEAWARAMPGRHRGPPSGPPGGVARGWAVARGLARGLAVR